MIGAEKNGIDLFKGCLVGLAVGDALGTTLEFKPPGTFDPIDDMVGGGPFKLKPGQWTDDTSMAMCLAESLLECDGFDPADQMRRYLRWWREGYWSSTGECFDIGNTVSAALSEFERTGEPYSGSTDERSSGNGCLMRLAPVPMAFADDPASAIERCADSSRTTHGSEQCVDASRYFGGLLVGALNGVNKATLLSPSWSPVDGFWAPGALAESVAEVANGSFKSKEPPEIVGNGYVIRSMEAALWAFAKTDDFRSGALLAVNLGNDADTTGAIYGQIAGAVYGASGIPERWRELVAMRDAIELVATRLFEGCSDPGATFS